MEWWVWVLIVGGFFPLLSFIGSFLEGLQEPREHREFIKNKKEEIARREKKRQAEEALQNLELEHKQWLDAVKETHRLEHLEWTQQFYDNLPFQTISVPELQVRPQQFVLWIDKEVQAGRAFLHEGESFRDSYVTYKEIPHYERRSGL